MRNSDLKTPILKRTAVASATLVSALFFAACVSTPGMVSEGNATWEPDPTSVAPPVNAPTANPQSGDTSADEMLRKDRQTLDLKEQRRKFLVDEHLKAAGNLRGRLRLQECRDQLLAALSLDSDNLDAKRQLAEVNALLGGDTGSVATTVTETLQQTTKIKTQQMRAQARDLLREGKALLAKGNYDGAIAQLTIASQTVHYAPYAIEWEGVDSEIESNLAAAKKSRTTAQAAALEQRQRLAFDQLQSREEADVMQRRALVENMLTQAIDAFDKARYEDAIYFADQALRRDPRNEKAEELRASAFKANQKQARAEYVTAKREQFKRWKEELNSYKIAWSDTITLPSAEEWAQLTETRKGRRGLDLTKTRSDADIALRKRLAGTHITLPEIDAVGSIRELMDMIRLMTALPLVVDPSAENEVLDGGIEFTFSFENQLTVEQALNLITDMAGPEVTWIVRHDAVLVTTREKARGEPVVVHHDVEDLVFGLTEFIGPRINRIRLLDELEDEDGGGPFGFVGEQQKLIDIDNLVTMIQENVETASWEEGGSLEGYDGHIIVVTTPEIQAKVNDFLEDLRNFSSSMVTIETKFMTVGDNWIQEIGVDFRGLADNPLSDITNGLEDMASRGLDNGGTGSAGSNAAGAPSSGFYYNDEADGDMRGRTENFFGSDLGETLSTMGGMTFQYSLLNDLELAAVLRAVEKSQNLVLINDQVLSVHNTQRAYVTILNQRAYIQDFDVEVATFQAVADPQINVLNEGVVLDVRPTIHHDRRYVTLEVQPTVAKVVNVRRYSTTLGGNTSPVEFELPELEVQSVFTTAHIPDGGSILLGGLTDIRNVERRAEIPWLARIPLVGFFFKSEGYNDENKSLIILIQAKITDVREEVARIEAAY